MPSMAQALMQEHEYKGRLRQVTRGAEEERGGLLQSPRCFVVPRSGSHLVPGKHETLCL